MINSIAIALTGLNSASMRLNASASNIANVSTPQYTPITTKSETIDTGGVTTKYATKSPPFTNVNLIEEVVNMKMAEISYKASLNVIKTSNNMFNELIDINKD